MPNPPSQRTLVSMLPDMFMGAIFGLIIGPLSFAAGAACGFGIGSLGFAAATLSAIAITGCIAFVCGAGFGFSVGGFASTNAPAVSLGLGGSPLLVSVPFLLLDLRVESLYIAAIILGLGFTQALGGYVGCRFLPILRIRLPSGHWVLFPRLPPCGLMQQFRVIPNVGAVNNGHLAHNGDTSGRPR